MVKLITQIGLILSASSLLWVGGCSSQAQDQAPTQEQIAVSATAPPTSTTVPATEAVQTEGDQTQPISPQVGLRTFRLVPDQSEASYQVQEKFLNMPLPIEAIGRTKAVSGTFELDLSGQPTGRVVTMTIDLRTLTSDASLRDKAAQRWLNTSQYPEATFTSTILQEVPNSYNPGQSVVFKVLGNLTLRGVTRPAVFEVQATLDGNTVTGTATTVISTPDYNIPVENFFDLTIDNNITLRLDFTAVDEAQVQVAKAPTLITPPTATPAGVTAPFVPPDVPLATQQRIVFISQRDGNDELYLMNQDGSAQTRLTYSSLFETEPVWSPDGRKLAFVATEGRFEGNSDIYLLDIEPFLQSSGKAGLVNLTHSPTAEWAPAWSPDGKRLAFAAGSLNDSDIFVMLADGSERVNLTNSSTDEFRPAWSPDGTKLAYIAGQMRFDLYMMNADGSDQVNLTEGSVPYVDYPVWSPDGRHLAFSAGQNNTEIYVIETTSPEAQKPIRLTNSPAFDGFPVWSPDGAWLAFRTYRDGNFEIYLMKADGSNQVNLTNNSADDESPTWSADGSQLTFASDREGKFQLYSLDVKAFLDGDESEPLQLTTDPAGAGGPVWQPNPLLLTDNETNPAMPVACVLTPGGTFSESALVETDLPSSLQLADEAEPGEPLVVRGTVYEEDCTTPLAGAIIEVWQANDEGEYTDLEGTLRSDAQGRYEIETIKPGFYGAPAHIHYRISHPQARSLETELFFAGDPHLDANAPTELVRPLTTEETPAGPRLKSIFDIVLRSK